MTFWQIKIKRPLRGKSVYVLCYGHDRLSSITEATPYALRKPMDITAGMTQPVLIDAPTEAKALLKAESLVRQLYNGKAYEPRVARL